MHSEFTDPNDRLAIARELSSLAPGIELNQVPHAYYSLAIGSGPNKNVAIIRKSTKHVSFYIQDQSLIAKLKEAGFEVETFHDPSERPFSKEKYKITPITLAKISDHRSLLEETLRHSIKVIEKRRTKKH